MEAAPPVEAPRKLLDTDSIAPSMDSRNIREKIQMISLSKVGKRLGTNIVAENTFGVMESRRNIVGGYKPDDIYSVYTEDMAFTTLKINDIENQI